MSVRLQISHDDETIQFLNEEFGILGFTDYTSKAWEELSLVNWYVDEKKLLMKQKPIFIRVQSDLEN